MYCLISTGENNELLILEKKEKKKGLRTEKN